MLQWVFYSGERNRRTQGHSLYLKMINKVSQEFDIDINTDFQFFNLFFCVEFLCDYLNSKCVFKFQFQLISIN